MSGTTLILVSGTAALYLIAIGTASSAFSIPVTAGESMTMNPAGKLIEVGSSGGSGDGFKAGGLSSLTMRFADNGWVWTTGRKVCIEYDWR